MEMSNRRKEGRERERVRRSATMSLSLPIAIHIEWPTERNYIASWCISLSLLSLLLLNTKNVVVYMQAGRRFAPAAVDPAHPGDPSIDPLLLLNSPARHRPPPCTSTFQRFFKRWTKNKLFFFLLLYFWLLRKKLAPKQKLKKGREKILQTTSFCLFFFCVFFCCVAKFFVYKIHGRKMWCLFLLFFSFHSPFLNS